MNNNSTFSQISENQRSDIHSTLHEFNKLFEDQLNSIDGEDNDNMKNKIQIYEEWVKRLLEEISTLVDCIQEMENQTAHGLDILTKNLNITCLPDDRIRALQNDLNATVEIIRRARMHGQWNIDGIKLESMTFKDVFSDQSKNEKNTYLEFEQPDPNNPNLYTLNIEMNAEPIAGKPKSDIEMRHNRQSCKSQPFPTALDIYEIDNDHANIMNDVKVNYAEQEISFKKLEKRNIELIEEIQRLKQKNQLLEKANGDTKVLVDEVATRHDEIQRLKKENMSLEEQLKNLDKSMCYKDEIIKELRKDCKKLSSSTPPMSNKIVQSSGNSEVSRNVDNSDNNDPNDIISEKNYNRKTDITNRLLEIFNFVQSSLQPSDYVYPSDSGILFDYLPTTMSNDVISDEDLNTALMSFASRMNSLEKENVKFQAENEKLKEELMEKTEEVKILIQKPSTDDQVNIVFENVANPNCTCDDGRSANTKRSPETSPEISQMDKHLSDDGSLFKNSNIEKLTNQVAGLQQEIDSKNKILHEKDKMIASLIECGILKDGELNDLRNRISSIQCDSNKMCMINRADNAVEKHLSPDDGSISVKNGDVDQLVVEMQQEIESKDKLLKEKDELIVSLRECEISKNIELQDLRKKIESNSNRNEETVSNLRDALDIHIKTINQQQLGNNHLENKIKDLQFYISNIDRNYVLLQEKYRKLELECNDQLTTISNLRSVVEEYSKRSGNASTTNYDILNRDNLTFDTFVLSEQIYDLFNENVQYERKINLLQDDNLYLRGEICLWSQDYNYLEDKYLVYLSETRDTYESKSSNESRPRNFNIKCKQQHDCKPRSIFTENTSPVLQYIRNMEDNIIDELKNYKNSVEDFRSFKDSIEEFSSQLNILSDESKFSQKLIEDSTLLLGSFQHLQQENENLKNKYELSQKQIGIIEGEVTELKSENIALKQELNNQETKTDEQIKRVENEKKSLTEQLNQSSVAIIHNLTNKNADLTTKISEQSNQRQRDIDEFLITHQEYQRAKDVSAQLTNEVAQLKNMINELNQEILRQSLALEKQKDDRYTMSKQLESAFEITEKLKFTIDSNLKSISHLHEENEKLKQELNQNICTIEKLQTDYNTRELEMINKTDSLQQSIDDHIKVRRVSDKSLLDMSIQNQKLNQQNEDLVTEIVHLKDEIIRLKTQINNLESNNALISDMQDDVGHVRSQLEKLLENESEITNLRKLNSILNHQVSEHVNGQRMQETKLAKVIEKCKEMKAEYDLLKNNYEKLYEIKEKVTQSLSVSQNAIEELKEREDLCNQLLAKQDEHIRTLLHDRSALTIKIDQMHRDMIILNNRLESVDSTPNQYAPSSETVTRRTKLIKYRSVPSLNTPDETMQSIRKIKRKIYETRNFWQNGMEEVFK